ncbi:hypothetical protein BSKO_08003 [Bryopsis sp. KO-2023]|nr:hypothetical protein BSKO_08003 [Bryopsis sp. KO-2023]
MENGAVESRLLASTKANLPTQHNQLSRIGKPERKLSAPRGGVTVLSATAGIDPMATHTSGTALDEGRSVENNTEFGGNSAEMAEQSGQGNSSNGVGVLGTTESHEEEEEVCLTLNPRSSCSNGENLTRSEGQDFMVTLESRGASADIAALEGNRVAPEMGDELGVDSAHAHSQGATNEENMRVDLMVENIYGPPPDDVGGRSNSEHGKGAIASQNEPSVVRESSERGGGDDFGDFAEAVVSVAESGAVLGIPGDAGNLDTCAGNQPEPCDEDEGSDGFGKFSEAGAPPIIEDGARGKPESRVGENLGKMDGAEEFGDFVETSMTEQTVGQAPESDEADFGDFADAEVSTSPTKNPNFEKLGNDSFDDFGDFAEAEVSVSVAQKGEVTDAGSDDFGDFGDFAEASPAPLPPTPQSSGMEFSDAGASLDAGTGPCLDGFMSMSQGALLSAVTDILKPLLAEPPGAGSSQQPIMTSTAGVSLKDVGETKFRLPPGSVLGANLLQVKPVPPGFLRGCGPPAVLAARVARTEQKLLRSLGLLDAYTRASMEEQFTAETEEPASGSESFRGILESGSISSMLETPRVVETPVATDGDLDFLVQASAGSGVLPAQTKSDLSFSSTGEPLAVSTPLNSSGSPTNRPTNVRHNRDLSSIFDTLADLAPIIPNAAETEEPPEGGPVDEPGMEPPKPRVSIEPVKSLDMWGMGGLTTLEAASAAAAEPVDGDFDGLDDLIGPSAEIQRAMQGSILIEKGESGRQGLKPTDGGVPGIAEQLPVSSEVVEGPDLEAESKSGASEDFGGFVGGGGPDESGIEVLHVREENQSGGMDVFGGFLSDGLEAGRDADGATMANTPESSPEQSGVLETEAAVAPSQTPATELSSFPGFDDFLGTGTEPAVPLPNKSNTVQVSDASFGDGGFGDFLAGGEVEGVVVDDESTQIGPDDNPTVSSKEQPMSMDHSADLEWGGFESPKEISPPGEVTQDAKPDNIPDTTPEILEPEDLFTDDWLVSLKGNKKPEQEANSVGAVFANQGVADSNGVAGNDDGEWGDFSTAPDPPHQPPAVVGDASDPFGFLTKKLGVSPQAEVEVPKPAQSTRLAMKDMATLPKKHQSSVVASSGVVSSKPLELFDGLDIAGDESTVEGGIPGSIDFPIAKSGDDDEWGGFQDM